MSNELYYELSDISLLVVRKCWNNGSNNKFQKFNLLTIINKLITYDVCVLSQDVVMHWNVFNN